ncbi:hypothetical protein F66182_13523 [Fusarium sp. NRRL 66182]|nr:hypothetical protein F66182_13523 [Fusarium sp. NRRL 66182]
MDINAELQSDLVERRRLQNRLAQRKFRAEKKRRAAENSHSNTTQSPNVPAEASAPQANISTGDPVLSATTMLSSLDALIEPITNEDRETAEMGLDSQVIDRPGYQETHNTTFLSSDMATFPLDSVLSGLEEETTLWDSASWNILTNRPSNDNTDILASNEKQNESPDLTPSTSGHELLLQPNDESLSGVITFSKQKGWTGALHIAAQRGHKQILQVLIQSGNTDVNQQDSDGRTPLLHAAMQNHETAVRLLLTHGARIGILDCDGRSDATEASRSVRADACD